MNIQIIPAIDIIEGRCVRLTQGDYNNKTIYEASPVEMAKRYADIGVKRIHVVDLDGAKSSEPRNLITLEKMAYNADVKIEWGGGIKNSSALRDVFNAGADYAIVGSIAVTAPDLFKEWMSVYGGNRMILGADVRDKRISVNGWLEDIDTGIEELVETFLPYGLHQVICTDISKDGMLQGPNFTLYKELQGKYLNVDFTVSGGIGDMSDIERLNNSGLRKVIVGKAIYENKITLKDIERWLQNG